MFEKIQYWEIRVQTCTTGHNGGKALHVLFSWRTRIITSSVSGQDEPNLALWLATWAGKMELSCPLRIRALSRKKNVFIFWCFIQNNKSFKPTKLVRSRWLDIGLIHFLRVCRPRHCLKKASIQPSWLNKSGQSERGHHMYSQKTMQICSLSDWWKESQHASQNRQKWRRGRKWIQRKRLMKVVLK